MSRETWYVMDDGSFGDPNDIVHDGSKLRHKDGRAVAYGPHGPRSSGVDADVERAKIASREAPSERTTEMKPGAGKGYRTRAAKE